jgi:hypothetical protein
MWNPASLDNIGVSHQCLVILYQITKRVPALGGFIAVANALSLEAIEAAGHQS